MAGRVLESEPDHVGALLIRSEARARNHKDLELALADADRVSSLDPDRPRRVEAAHPRAARARSDQGGGGLDRRPREAARGQ
jgi:hypothetical protein